jgi:DNA repair exonuclease SbcCD nuclease subunit
MRFVHSSDLQIGKSFGFFAPEIANLLQNERHDVLNRLGEIAIQHDAPTVLLAGDIFDKQQLTNVTIRKPIEIMRRFSQVIWHLMPGNHDCLRENGLWDRLARMQLPNNVRLHVTSGTVEIAKDPIACLLPAPLRYISSADDLTSYMDSAPTPDGAIRIGIAHGSVRGFGSEGEASNYISPSRAQAAGLAYLALGDWHRQMQIGERIWYSGTPEPDAFKLPPDSSGTLCNGGSALIVEIAGPRAAPVVMPVETGRYRWHSVTRQLADEAQIELLDGELRALDIDLGKVVLNLKAAGTLSLAARKLFEERIAESIAAAVRGMRLDASEIVLEPSESDLDEIDRSGFIRVAADRLKAATRGADLSQAEMARRALNRLYLENIRQGAQS